MCDTCVFIYPLKFVRMSWNLQMYKYHCYIDSRVPPHMKCVWIKRNRIKKKTKNFEHCSVRIYIILTMSERGVLGDLNSQGFKASVHESLDEKLHVSFLPMWDSWQSLFDFNQLFHIFILTFSFSYTFFWLLIDLHRFLLFYVSFKRNVNPFPWKKMHMKWLKSKSLIQMIWIIQFQALWNKSHPCAILHIFFFLHKKRKISDDHLDYIVDMIMYCIVLWASVCPRSMITQFKGVAVTDDSLVLWLRLSQQLNGWWWTGNKFPKHVSHAINCKCCHHVSSLVQKVVHMLKERGRRAASVCCLDLLIVLLYYFYYAQYMIISLDDELFVLFIFLFLR